MTFNRGTIKRLKKGHTSLKKRSMKHFTKGYILTLKIAADGYKRQLGALESIEETFNWVRHFGFVCNDLKRINKGTHQDPGDPFKILSKHFIRDTASPASQTR